MTLRLKAEADLLVLRADGHAVVRHDLARAGLERRLEGLQVQLELAARVHLLAAVREVGVLAAELRAAAGEVLRHGRDRVGAELAALEAADVRGAEPARELDVLAEGGELTRPARLGREVDLGVQGDADADGRVLLARDVAEPLDERLVADGREAERLGPRRERAGEHARERVVAVRVAGVGRDRDGDAGPGAGGELLQPVVPLGHRARRRRRLQDVEVVHEPAGDVLGVRRQAEPGVGVGELAVGAHRDHGLEAEPGLLLQSHLGEQDLDALGDGQLRVEVAAVDGGGCRGIRRSGRLVGHLRHSFMLDGPRCGVRRS